MGRRIVLPADFNVSERQSRAESLFLQGYNCSQAVLLAFSDILQGVDEDTLKVLASGLGGGVARLREVCGAVSAMAVISGFASPACVPADMESRTANYALVQDMARQFKEEKGSIVCREILGIRKTEKEGPRPSERTPDYYRTRPCVANVGLAARIVAKTLISIEK